MRAYKLLFATLLAVLLLAVAVDGTVLELLSELWADLQRSPPA
ncbi:hypothetical protein [Natronomonas amylolytica]